MSQECGGYRNRSGMEGLLMKLSRLFLIVFIYGALQAHELAAVHFIQDFLKPGDLVFDVGAHHGNKTTVYLACGARVICFEPQPECVKKLKDRFLNNKNVVIEQCGLSFKDDVLTFFSSGESTLSTFSAEWTHHSRFSEHGYTWDKILHIPVTTLDSMIAKHGVPQFCKIDVENYEYEVLQGLTKAIPYVSFEFTKEYFHKTEASIRYLQQLGYRTFNVSLGETDRFLFIEWVTADTLLTTLKKACINDIYLHDPWGLWGDIYAHY